MNETDKEFAGGETALARAEERPQSLMKQAVSVKDLSEQINFLQDLVRKVMVKDVDYGTIPGTDKPTLLKSGAEKLLMTFRLRAIIDETKDIVVKELPDGHREYLVTCHILTWKGIEIATGLGSCTTMESRYRYRKASLHCPKCGRESVIKGKQEYGGGWICFAKKGGCGAKFGDDDVTIVNQPRGLVENKDIADVYNTVLKMAKKRSVVDGSISATAASGLVTQDMEEAPHDEPPIEPEVFEPEPKPQSRRETKPTQTPPPPKPAPKEERREPEPTPPAESAGNDPSLLPLKKRAEIVAAFGQLDILQEEIETILGEVYEKWNVDHKTFLLGLFKKMQAGEMTKEEFMEQTFGQT